MTRTDEYRRRLRELADWDDFLLAESGLPGPRGNLELSAAVAEEGDEELFRRYRESHGPEVAPTNDPREFLAFCGVRGLGKSLGEGKTDALETLRPFASDPRWRIREAVVFALQRLGGRDMDALIREMESWGRGNLLEKRAAAAALCDPGLLGEESHARQTLRLLDAITASMLDVEDRKSDEFKAFRKGMGYCWSVAVAAMPDEGKKLMEKWLDCDDRDVLWVMKQNLKKNRLERMDPGWVKKSLEAIR